MRNVTVLVTLLAAVTAHAQTPKEFIAAMKARREGIKTVKYELEVTSHQLIVSDPKTQEFVESKRKPTVKVYTLELDLARGWMIKESKGEEYTPIKGGDVVIRSMHGCSTFHEGLFRTIQWPPEGGTAVGLEPGRASDYAEIRGDLSAQVFMFPWQPAFANVGLLPLSTRSVLCPGRFHEAGPNTDDDDLLGEVTGRGERGKKVFECLQVADARVRRKLEIVVDSQTPSRVLALTKTNVSVDRIECKYNADGLQSWEHRATLNGKLHYSNSFRVVSCQLNQPIDERRYHLKPEAGMVARKIEQSRDANQNTSESFKVSPSGNLEKITSDFDRKPPPATFSIWWLVAGVGLSASAVAALVLFWRRRVRRCQSPTPKEPT